MKSLFLAPALVSFIHTDPAIEAATVSKPLPELVVYTQIIEDRPLVELQAPPPFVPVVAREDDDRLGDLKKELEGLAENLKATQQAVENVAAQRDQARDEVRALTKANHEMLAEMKGFRKELAMSRQEAEKWKEHAAAMERKANDQALANASLEKFRAELQAAMTDFQDMKGDIAKARAEFADPIERVSLKQELAKSKAKQERLSAEIEMALIAREKTITEAARTRKELEGKMATLMQQAKRANELEDELRETNAVKMKALADIEVLRKGLARTGEARDEALAKLETAQNGLTALQAEKAAAMEARAVAMQERDEAQAGRVALQKQVDTALAELENSKRELAATGEKMQAAEEAKAVAVKERDALQTARQDLATHLEAAHAQIEDSKRTMAEMDTQLKAAEEARAVAIKEQEAAQTEMNRVQAQLKKMEEDLAATRKDAAEASKTARNAQEAREASKQQLADAAGVLEKTKEEVEFLTKAKGGLEELLFRKTAEIRKLKGELRKVQASRDESSEPPAKETEEDAERATAQAFAD